MIKQFIVLLFLSLCSHALFSQLKKEDVIGDWIKYKAERLDSSTIIDRIGLDSAFLELSFSPKEFSMQHRPAEMKQGFDYYLKNGQLNVGMFSSYQIEKINKDTLGLSDVAPSEPAHKLNRYYLVRKEVLSKKNPSKIEDGILIFNKYTFPRVDKAFAKYLETCNSDDTKFFRMRGALVFDRQKKSIVADIEFLEEVAQNKIQTIKSCLENTYQYWDFDGTPAYPSSKIYFIAQSYQNSNNIRFQFCPDDLSDFSSFHSIDFDAIDKSKDHFKKGVSDLENEALDAAIENFTLSFQLDPVRIDALYKRAEAYLLKEDVKSACEDWEALMTKGQKLAASKHEQHCR